jgi:hypothetical protein
MRPFLNELLTVVRRPLELRRALCLGAGAVYGLVLHSIFNTSDSDFAKLALFGAVAIATAAFAILSGKCRAQRQRRARLDELYGRESSR